MAMQLRSGRRLASPVPAPTGDLRRVRPRRSQDDVNKDRISSLPENMQLEVLTRLPCTREAMRTSILSEPWRRLWTELRELTFDDVTDLDSLLNALAEVQPKLNRLRIKIPSDYVLGADSISSLLHAADRLEPLELVVWLTRDSRSLPLLLPCFARATSIELCVSPLLRLRLPPTGSFASLEQLTLLGANSSAYSGVLVPRCPRLRRLVMDGSCSRGIRSLAVESSSLEELVWHMLDIDQPVHLRVAVVAPNLERFVLSCLSRKTTMSLSAPKLEELDFGCCIEGYTVGCAENPKWRLYELKVEMGRQGGRHGGRQHVLSLYIDNVTVIPPVERSFAEEVARLSGTLTRFSALELHLVTEEGHVFGALVLQLLRIRTTIKRLKVILLGEEQDIQNAGGIVTVMLLATGGMN